jgi:hypothetical protein
LKQPGKRTRIASPPSKCPSAFANT